MTEIEVKGILMTKSRNSKITTYIAILIALCAGLLFGTAEAKAETYKESSYNHVYDYNFYVSRYPALKTHYKGNRYYILCHYIKYGMKEGRKGISTYDVNYYKSNYPALKDYFQGNNLKITMHFQKYGYKEGRVANTLLKNCSFTVKIDPNGGTYNSSSKVTSLTKAYNTTVTLATPKRSGYSFTGWKLTGRGSVSGSKYTFSIAYKYTVNTLTAQWESNTFKASSASKEAMVKFALARVGTGGQETWNYWNCVEEWCCMFVSYCADKGGNLVDRSAGEDRWGAGKFPKSMGQRQLAANFKSRGQLVLASTGYKPQRGDIIFFSNYTDKSYTSGYRHVGIVTGSDSKYVYTVEGNTVTYDKYTSKVAEKKYELTSSKIASYGIIK